MKIMNREKGKKIAVMAAVIVGFMVIAFMPAASAGVTSFTVTPGTGLAGVVDSYTALVTTDGVTEIGITVPAGFIAVAPIMGGVQIARVDFWNSSTKAYYGFATITSNNADPTTKVDIHCDFGGLTVSIPQTVNYNPGALNTFVSGFECDHSAATLKLPTEDDDGWINIAIDCIDCPCFSENWRLDDVSINIGQFVRNPTTAKDYVFSADGVDETVRIIAPGGCGAVFRNGPWYLDTNGDHMTDINFVYGTVNDIPVVGDVNGDGRDDDAVFRAGVWYVDTTGNHYTNMCFVYGTAGDKPLIGDFNQDGRDDTAVFRAGVWYVDTTGNHYTNMCFVYGTAGDKPLIGDFNQDGRDDTAVFRAGVWYVDTTGNHYTNMCFVYGTAGDQPIVGDINQDGRVDTAVLRGGGTWYVDTTGNHITNLCYRYGATGDLKIGGYFR